MMIAQKTDAPSFVKLVRLITWMRNALKTDAPSWLTRNPYRPLPTKNNFPFIIGERKNYENKTKIIGPFLIARTALTQLQYFLITGKAPAKEGVVLDTNSSDYLELRGVRMNANRPVVDLTWKEAEYFIKNIGSKIQVRTILKFRLPIEAEWEYATRAGTRGVYFFNKRIIRKTAAGIQVAFLPLNRLGLDFSSGYNWCSDFYCDKLHGGVDPVGGETRNRTRVVRGFVSCGDRLRSASRAYMPEESSSGSVGVRLVMDY